MDRLKLENQLCFALYIASKEMIRKYQPLLDKVDLTYTQYLTMLVLWEKKELNVSDLGKMLYLDSGTITPILKKLESKELITRTRSKTDERSVVITLTGKGNRLQEKATEIRDTVASCVTLKQEDALHLFKTLKELNLILTK